MKVEYLVKWKDLDIPDNKKLLLTCKEESGAPSLSLRRKSIKNMHLKSRKKARRKSWISRDQERRPHSLVLVFRWWSLKIKEGALKR